MRILVTGASGFVGAHLALGLSRLGHAVISVCNRHPCALEVTVASDEVCSVDLTQKNALSSLLQKSRPDVIVHAAALANTTLCQQNPEQAHLVNVTATENILSSVAEQNGDSSPLLIYISTDLVFDGKGSAPEHGFSEKDAPQPRSVYGVSKYHAEQVVAAYPGKSALFRLCLAYGARIGDCSGFMGWLLGGLSEGKSVTLYTDEWRTPVLLDDLVSSVARFIDLTSGCDRKRRGSLLSDYPIVYHIAGAERVSRYGFGLKVAEVFGYEHNLLVAKEHEHIDTSVPRAQDVSLSSEKLRKELGVHPRDALSGLREMAKQASKKRETLHFSYGDKSA